MTTETKEDLIKSIDNAKTTGFHYKTWLISGLGFFTDAYDLFIIGVVTSILALSGWNSFSTLETSLLDSTALLSAVIGALIFGRLLDKLGRKAIYGIELIILVIGALGSAFLTPVNGVYILIAWRFILGIGIGGDYATSSTIMAEYSNTASRGKLVGMVFSMQSLGLLAGPLISLGLIFSGIDLALVWKLLLAIGAIPALAVVYYRRKMPETPRYLVRVKGDTNSATKNWQKYTGIATTADASTETVKESWTSIMKQKKFLLTLLGTAGSWFLMDWALYGNSIMSSSMLSALVPSSVVGLNHLIRTTEYSAMVFGLAALPGYWLATFTIDRIGRKPIQMVGFAAMAISFGILGIFHQLLSATFVAEFLVIYGISYFFIEFGPNVTTFIYPPEVFPTKVRGFGSGASAAGGKTGAFIGTFLNVIILSSSIGESGLFLILAFLSVMGLVLTIFLLPEPKRMDLDQISGENGLLEGESVKTGIKAN
ncbi:MAG: MFS transporter [Candidatus Thermoplasmatota archaeon]|jgi:PHS family inorganic phosphate transporter-like MFS transporter|nr:MFS transporter [Candidatus Thermoplasmatota archaeon]